MIITNNLGLPQVIVDACKEENHEPVEKRYSVTELLKPVREIVLTRKYHKILTCDVSDLSNALLGKGVHKVFEVLNKEGSAEERIEYTLENGYTISGIIDLWDEENLTIIDYKTCSVSKVQKQDFDDWVEQALCYAWLKLKKDKVYVDKVKVIALIKDWSKIRASTDPYYPKSPFYVHEVKVTDYELRIIETKLRFKIDQLINCENNDLPMCSDAERWFTGNKYAVMRKGAKKAYKLVDTLKEAEIISSDLDNSIIELRKGNYTKCDFYCPVRKWCYNEREE